MKLVDCEKCRDKCCEEIAVHIATPSSADDFRNIRWFLYHPGVSIEVDKNGCWWTKFDSACSKLDKHGKCTIYPKRPPVCKNLMVENCDANNPPKEEFRSVRAYERWLKRVFKKA